MLSLLTDATNFTVGAVSGGFSRAGRWGNWALGWRGDEFDSRHNQFQQIRVGGLIIPSILVGLAVSGGLISLAAIGISSGIVAGGAAYFGGIAATTVLGGVTGALQGGFGQMTEGWAARREWADQKAQVRDQDRLEALGKQRQREGRHMEKAQGRMQKTHDKMQRVQDRMHKRAEKGGHVNRLLEERASAGGRGRG